MLVKIPSQRAVKVVSYKEASELYSKARDESGEGASTWGLGFIKDRWGNKLAYISYNGKVWAGQPGESGGLLFDPFV